MKPERVIFVRANGDLYEKFEERFLNIDIKIKEYVEACMLNTIGQTDEQIADLMSARLRWFVLEGGKNGKNSKTEKILATAK